MHELLSADEMQAADRAAVAAGIDSMALMEQAGRAVARRAYRMTPRHRAVAVFAGPGNNGGDGYVAARWLERWRVAVTVVALGEPKADSDAATARDAYAGPRIELPIGAGGACGASALPAAVSTLLADCGLCIDALFGAGLSRPLEGLPRRLVEAMNAWRGDGRYALAVDLPSGIDGNAIRPAGDVAVVADHTITFFRYKPAHLVRPTRDLCGRLELVPIGIPISVLAEIAPSVALNVASIWRDKLPQPLAGQHKFDRGHVLVRCGPAARTGAARLAAEAALASGAGLVTLAVPRDAQAIVASQSTAVMLADCDDSDAWRDLVADRRITATVIGPGNGVNAATRSSIDATVANGTACVIDADGITSMVESCEALFERIAASAAPVVLTPHEGEFERLFGEIATAEPSVSRLHRARAAAAVSHAVVVLKGSDTLVAAPDGRVRVNANAPAWLATAGAGDVLSGLVAALLAQGVEPFDAAAAAVWLHADAAWRCGAPLTAERLVDGLPGAIGALLDQRRPIDADSLPA